MLEKIRSEVVTMTPDLARQFLRGNQGNRKVRKSHVEFISNSMLRGEWGLTHQGIAISEDGFLLDGQHRLLAVISANIPVQMMVTYGLDRNSAFPLIDGFCIRRTDSDRLGIDKRTLEVARFLAARVFSWNEKRESRKFTNLQLTQICGVIGEHHDTLMSYCSSMVKFMSCASTRAAAISSVLLGQDRDYVFSLYRDMILSELDSLPPCGKSIIKQAINGTLRKGKNGIDLDGFARMLYVFDKENANTSKVSIRDPVSFVSEIRKKLIIHFPFIRNDKENMNQITNSLPQ